MTFGAFCFGADPLLGVVEVVVVDVVSVVEGVVSLAGGDAGCGFGFGFGCGRGFVPYRITVGSPTYEEYQVSS